MKTKVTWDGHRTVGIVQSAEATGMPYLGTVRKQALLDGWTATSAIYSAPAELGVFATEDEAVDALVRNATSLSDRRETSRLIALAGAVPRITGTGRVEVEAPAEAKRLRKYATRGARKSGRVRDADLAADGSHCEVTP